MYVIYYRIKTTNSLGSNYDTGPAPSGYSFSTYIDSFETATINSSTPPQNWATELVSGSIIGISFVATMINPTVDQAYNGAIFVKYNSYGISSGSSRLKKTASYSTVGKSSISIKFGWHEDPGYSTSNDKVEVQWTTGSTWTTKDTFSRYNATQGWKEKTSTITDAGALGQSTIYFGFLFTSAYGNSCGLDHVRITIS